ncbi:hypothetical protein FE783_24545 [Paenibacillus mesophilus]|uniref:hypothetical protein n=1 Tax=Paenibacillus mesophilus TaxID=2582849 RepID=UPI00110E5DAA|nr:hypothetical protein [Paenibacillus mesophilus]TMV46813.1 hypothetical protein FE783_24545 [Paenibacillus mesophilus]
MKLSYDWDAGIVRIQESGNGDDTEFQIELVQDQPYAAAMRRVQQFFEDNQVHTDVLFYLYPGHKYRVIVRKDYYNDFLLELLKHRLLRSLEWN